MLLSCLSVPEDKKLVVDVEGFEGPPAGEPREGRWGLGGGGAR